MKRTTNKTNTKPTKPKQEPAQQTQELVDQFRELRLPSFRDHFQETTQRANQEGLSYLDYLSELTTLECDKICLRRLGFLWLGFL